MIVGRVLGDASTRPQLAAAGTGRGVLGGQRGPAGAVQLARLDAAYGDVAGLLFGGDDQVVAEVHAGAGEAGLLAAEHDDVAHLELPLGDDAQLAPLRRASRRAPSCRRRPTPWPAGHRTRRPQVRSRRRRRAGRRGRRPRRPRGWSRRGVHGRTPAPGSSSSATPGTARPVASRTTSKPPADPSRMAAELLGVRRHDRGVGEAVEVGQPAVQGAVVEGVLGLAVRLVGAAEPRLAGGGLGGQLGRLLGAEVGGLGELGLPGEPGLLAPGDAGGDGVRRELRELPGALGVLGRDAGQVHVGVAAREEPGHAADDAAALLVADLGVEALGLGRRLARPLRPARALCSESSSDVLVGQPVLGLRTGDAAGEVVVVEVRALHQGGGGRFGRAGRGGGDHDRRRLRDRRARPADAAAWGWCRRADMARSFGCGADGTGVRTAYAGPQSVLSAASAPD